MAIIGIAEERSLGLAQGFGLGGLGLSEGLIKLTGKECA